MSVFNRTVAEMTDEELLSECRRVAFKNDMWRLWATGDCFHGPQWWSDFRHLNRHLFDGDGFIGSESEVRFPPGVNNPRAPLFMT